MATLTIDGERSGLAEWPETLGDLLAAVDGAAGRRGRILTVLRLDGVDEPAFREPHIASARTSDFGQIEIESSTPADLASECLAEAARALDSLAGEAGRVAGLYMTGASTAAGQELAAITDGIGTAFAITNAASLGLGIDLTAHVTAEGSIADLTRTTSTELEALITAQSEEEWAAVGYRLEAGLAPVLRRWAAACRALDPAAVR